MRLRKSLEAFIKGFQRPFAAYGIAEEHHDKIDYFVPPEAATGKAHLFFDGRKHPPLVGGGEPST